MTSPRQRKRRSDPDLELLELDLDLATNFMGRPIADDARDRLIACWRDPTEQSWEAAHAIILNDAVGLGMTLWQAVRAVDPTFPASGPSWTEHGRRIRGWSRVPDAALIRAAIHHATHPPARVRTYDEHGTPHDEVLRTRSGRVLTDEELARLAHEAESDEADG
jgi:hypothetical protein